MSVVFDSSKCNHIIGLETPRHGEHKFIFYSDRNKAWRGTICWFCPNCGILLWDIVEKEDKNGKYRTKELVV